MADLKAVTLPLTDDYVALIVPRKRTFWQWLFRRHPMPKFQRPQIGTLTALKSNPTVAIGLVINANTILVNGTIPQHHNGCRVLVPMERKPVQIGVAFEDNCRDKNGRLITTILVKMGNDNERK